MLELYDELEDELDEEDFPEFEFDDEEDEAGGV